jgi:hypothetical protein
VTKPLEGPHSGGGNFGLADLDWPTLSKEDRERVTKLVRPKSSQRDDCLREAAISVQWIKRKTTASRTPRQRKKALINVAKKIAAAIKSIESLPEATQREIDPKALRRTVQITPLLPELGNRYELWPGTLQQLHDRTLALVEKITVKRHSGGKKRGRIDAAQKRAAADCALAILGTWGSRPPTLYRDGPYFELAALLFELATGKKNGDVELACIRVYKEQTLHKKISSRYFEEWEMLFEDDGVPKVFEDSD